MYAFATPNNATDGGINHIAPISAALRRSSATHFPARFLRHFFIMRSETRPEIGAPTFHVGGGRRWAEFADEGAEAKGNYESGTNSGYQHRQV